MTTTSNKARRVFDRLKRLVVHRKCNHTWIEDLIFGSPPNTHHIVGRCNKCGFSKEIWRGTRTEWQKEKAGFPTHQ